MTISLLQSILISIQHQIFIIAPIEKIKMMSIITHHHLHTNVQGQDHDPSLVLIQSALVNQCNLFPNNKNHNVLQ